MKEKTTEMTSRKSGFRRALTTLCTAGAIIGLCSAAQAQTSKPLTAQWNVRDHIKPADIIVQAHRGAGAIAPENTIEAFELGWKLHTIPEADVRTTTDGVIVAFHDANFKRLVKNVPEEYAGKAVKDLTLAELKKLDVGSWMGPEFAGQRAATMEEIFIQMKHIGTRHVYLDIKDVDLQKLADLVKKHGVNAQVILASPRHDELIEWKKMVPESDTLLWVGGKTGEEQMKKFDAARERDFEGLTQVQIHANFAGEAKDIKRTSIDPFNVPDAYFIEAGNAVREKGILFQSLGFGVSDKDFFWKLLDLGVMSFATDYPESVRATLEEYYTLPADPTASK